VSIVDDMSLQEKSRPDGGTFIRSPGAVVPHYELILRWGDEHGLPSDAAYVERRAAAYPPSGRRGRRAGMSPQRLRLAETARAMRAQGWPEGQIAFALLGDGSPPTPALVERLEQRLKKLERELRHLEKVEGRAGPLRPPRNTRARKAAARASADRERAG
jgi:hypothetical protein